MGGRIVCLPGGWIHNSEFLEPSTASTAAQLHFSRGWPTNYWFIKALLFLMAHLAQSAFRSFIFFSRREKQKMIKSHSVRLQLAALLYWLVSRLWCRHLPIWRSWFQLGPLRSRRKPRWFRLGNERFGHLSCPFPPLLLGCPLFPTRANWKIDE